MLALLVSLLVSNFHAAAPSAFARYDLGRYVARKNDGRAQSYRERLNVAAFAAVTRCTFESVEIAAIRERRALAIRCDVYAERHGFSGTRASFNVDAGAL